LQHVILQQASGTYGFSRLVTSPLTTFSNFGPFKGTGNQQLHQKSIIADILMNILAVFHSIFNCHCLKYGDYSFFIVIYYLSKMMHLSTDTAHLYC